MRSAFFDGPQEVQLFSSPLCMRVSCLCVSCVSPSVCLSGMACSLGIVSAHGFDETGSVLPRCPALVAFLRSCRPLAVRTFYSAESRVRSVPWERKCSGGGGRLLIVAPHIFLFAFPFVMFFVLIYRMLVAQSCDRIFFSAVGTAVTSVLDIFLLGLFLPRRSNWQCRRQPAVSLARRRPPRGQLSHALKLHSTAAAGSRCCPSRRTFSVSCRGVPLPRRGANGTLRESAKYAEAAVASCQVSAQARTHPLDSRRWSHCTYSAWNVVILAKPAPLARGDGRRFHGDPCSELMNFVLHVVPCFKGNGRETVSFSGQCFRRRKLRFGPARVT